MKEDITGAKSGAVIKDGGDLPASAPNQAELLLE